jgi:hypothetical protein
LVEPGYRSGIAAANEPRMGNVEFVRIERGRGRVAPPQGGVASARLARLALLVSVAVGCWALLLAVLLLALRALR